MTRGKGEGLWKKGSWRPVAKKLRRCRPLRQNHPGLGDPHRPRQRQAGQALQAGQGQAQGQVREEAHATTRSTPKQSSAATAATTEGATDDPPRRVLSLALLRLALSAPAAAQADFEFLPGSLSISAENSNGTLTTQASSHPYALSYHFALKTGAGGQTEGGSMRNLITDLPAGLIANPLAVSALLAARTSKPRPASRAPRSASCTRSCPGSGEANGPLYNLTPPPGVAAQVGFSSLGFTLLGSAGVRTEEGYGARVIADEPAAGGELGDGEDLGHPGRQTPRPRTGLGRTGHPRLLLRGAADPLPHPALRLRLARRF